MGITSQEDFGNLEKDCNSLVSLPVLEKAGIIWVILNSESNINMEKFLSGYDEMLDLFDLKNWHVFSTRVLKGPNWKVAYDGYLDLYHLPILHSETFGKEISNQANYYEWGPHQRVVSPLARISSSEEGVFLRPIQNYLLKIGQWICLWLGFGQYFQMYLSHRLEVAVGQ